MISRLCECIEGLELQEIGYALGIKDFKNYNLNSQTKTFTDFSGKKISTLEMPLFQQIESQQMKVNYY